MVKKDYTWILAVALLTLTLSVISEGWVTGDVFDFFRGVFAGVSIALSVGYLVLYAFGLNRGAK